MQKTWKFWHDRFSCCVTVTGRQAQDRIERTAQPLITLSFGVFNCGFTERKRAAARVCTERLCQAHNRVRHCGDKVTGQAKQSSSTAGETASQTFSCLSTATDAQSLAPFERLGATTNRPWSHTTLPDLRHALPLDSLSQLETVFGFVRRRITKDRNELRSNRRLHRLPLQNGGQLRRQYHFVPSSVGHDNLRAGMPARDRPSQTHHHRSSRLQQK